MEVKAKLPVGRVGERYTKRKKAREKRISNLTLRQPCNQMAEEQALQDKHQKKEKQFQKFWQK